MFVFGCLVRIVWLLRQTANLCPLGSAVQIRHGAFMLTSPSCIHVEGGDETSKREGLARPKIYLEMVVQTSIIGEIGYW